MGILILKYLVVGLALLFFVSDIFLSVWIYKNTKDWDLLKDVVSVSWTIKNPSLMNKLSNKQIMLLKTKILFFRALMIGGALLVIIFLIAIILGVKK